LELAVHAAERARDTADSLRAAMNDLTASLDPAEVGSRLAARVAAALPGAEVRLVPGDAGLPPQSGLLRCGADTAPAGLVPPGVADWLAVPLRIRGAAHGVLVVSTTDRLYADAEVGVVAAMAEQGATALDNALLFQRVEEMATRDGLTGLYNRRHFFELGEQQMRAWRRYHQPITAIMIDIDHFKSVNDTHGHAVGDDVIREVANRLGATLRDTDLVCRYGGEEFAVILVRTTDADAYEAAERLHKAVTGAPVLTSVGDLPITVSLGLAGPDSMCVDVEALLARADEALYKAKRAGRNRLVSYAP
jgi:diguanylate cyclase (GGDEF)-like protein